MPFRNITGGGEERDREQVAGVPGSPLPSRVARAKANDASRMTGYRDLGDHSCEGLTDMEQPAMWAGLDWSKPDYMACMEPSGLDGRVD